MVWLRLTLEPVFSVCPTVTVQQLLLPFYLLTGIVISVREIQLLLGLQLGGTIW